MYIHYFWFTLYLSATLLDLETRKVFKGFALIKKDLILDKTLGAKVGHYLPIFAYLKKDSNLSSWVPKVHILLAISNMNI